MTTFGDILLCVLDGRNPIGTWLHVLHIVMNVMMHLIIYHGIENDIVVVGARDTSLRRVCMGASVFPLKSVFRKDKSLLHDTSTLSSVGFVNLQ